MKILKYLTIIVSAICLFSCEKHEVVFMGEEELEAGMAEFRVHYVEPVVSGASTRFDSLFVNDVLYANTTNTFSVYGIMPTTNKYYVAPAGNVNIKCYRKGTVVYDFDATLEVGKQDVFIYNIEKSPKVLKYDFPYEYNNSSANAVNWGTDSTAYVEFYNFMYEEYDDNKVPYPGKIQYQYQDTRTEEWKNIGNPVAFGEKSGRVPVTVIKSVQNSSGYRTIYYRMLDEEGNVIKYTNSKGVENDFSYNLSTYIGRFYMHYSRGIRGVSKNNITAGITSKTLY